LLEKGPLAGAGCPEREDVEARPGDARSELHGGGGPRLPDDAEDVLEIGGRLEALEVRQVVASERRYGNVHAAPGCGSGVHLRGESMKRS
jgi:hypothetical protein